MANVINKIPPHRIIHPFRPMTSAPPPTLYLTIIPSHSWKRMKPHDTVEIESPTRRWSSRLAIRSRWYLLTFAIFCVTRKGKYRAAHCNNASSCRAGRFTASRPGPNLRLRLRNTMDGSGTVVGSMLTLWLSLRRGTCNDTYPRILTGFVSHRWVEAFVGCRPYKN